MTAIIEARGLTKNYGSTQALRGVDLNIQAGRIVGLIGPNGSGKTTAIKSILGLAGFDGELKVLGKDPRTERDALMEEVCFIADVAVLPRWIKVSQAVELVAGIHPRFDRKRAAGIPRQDRHQARQPGAPAVEGHGHAAASRADPRHRRQTTGARRADARPRPAVPPLVLRQPAERLLRQGAHHPRDHAPGGRDREHPDRRASSSSTARSCSIRQWKIWASASRSWCRPPATSMRRARSSHSRNARSSAASPCCSTAASSPSSPRWVKSARPRSRICSWP